MENYKSRSAREAQAGRYGDKSYWDYLDRYAQELHDYFLSKGDKDKAELMLNRSLSEYLTGNNGL